MSLEEKLTLVTPIRVAHPHHLREAQESIKTFYASLGTARPRHLIAAATPVASYHQAFIKTLDDVKAWVSWVSMNTTALEGFVQMIDAVKTPYVFLLLGDVKTMTTKDFMTPCIQAMDAEPTLMQVRICGHPFSSSARNTAPFYSDGVDISFAADKSIKFDQVIPVGEDIVWSLPTTPEKQKFFYAIPMWSTVMRTSYIRQLIDAVRPHLAGKKTLTNLSELLNGAEDLVKYNLDTTGWPAHLKFMDGYRQGSLNLSCYMYAFNREEKTQPQFLKEQMIEVKKIPAEGNL